MSCIASDLELHWESPRLGYFWCHNFVVEVYAKKQIEALLGTQEAYWQVSNDASGFAFSMPQWEAQRASRWATRRYLDTCWLDAYLTSVERVKAATKAMPWTYWHAGRPCSPPSIRALERCFQRAVALHLCSQPHLVSGLEEMLREDLEGRGSPEEVALWVGTLTGLTELPTVLREQRDWISIVRTALESDPDTVVSAVSRHVDRWRYITAGDSGRPMTLDSAMRRLGFDMRNPEVAVGQGVRLDRILDGSRAREIRSLERQLGGHVADLARPLRRLGAARFATKESWMKLWYLLESGLAALESQFGPGVEDFAGMELGSREQRTGNDRSRYVVTCRAGEVSVYYNGLEPEYERVASRRLAIDSELYGRCAFPGVRVGKVVRIGWGEDPATRAAEIVSDTVLVVPQTTPAFVPLLVRATALVADEGGVTGHASIIARELSIPAIVGARIATHALRDGDSVVVDATNGIVRRTEPQPGGARARSSGGMGAE